MFETFVKSIDDLQDQAQIVIKKDREQFNEIYEIVKTFCKENDVTLLRTIGIIFADENKDVSNYMR